MSLMDVIRSADEVPLGVATYVGAARIRALENSFSIKGRSGVGYVVDVLFFVVEY